MYHKTRLVFNYKKVISIIPELVYISNLHYSYNFNPNLDIIYKIS